MVTLNRVLRVIKDQGGFITETDLKILTQHDKLRQLLVRCNGCRFVCAAQDVDHLCSIIEASGKDYVRDVSLLSTDPVWLTVPSNL